MNRVDNSLNRITRIEDKRTKRAGKTGTTERIDYHF